jgi:MoaA/NifB/PqqE/SkfB family radical SAM enzyme
MDKTKIIKSENTYLNDLEIQKKRLLLESKVRNIAVTLTSACNLNCFMCGAKNTRWTLPGRIKDEIIELFPYIETVIWQGGEVFLYEGFEDLLNKASLFGVGQCLNTNALLIDQRMAEKLAEHNVVIAFSIDALTKDAFEFLRSGSNFEKTLEKIYMIKEIKEHTNTGMHMDINTVISSYNYRQIESFADFAAQNGFSRLNFIQMDCGEFVKEREAAYFNHDADAVNFIRDACRKAEEKCRNSGVYFNNELLCCTENKGNMNGMKETACDLPWKNLWIDMQGNIKPGCKCFHSLGNVSDISLHDAWNGEIMLNYRNKILSGEFSGFCNDYCLNKKTQQYCTHN